MQKIKSLFLENNYQKYLQLAMASQLPYTIKQSNYIIDIITPFFEATFFQNMQSNKTFVGSAMIKRDIFEKKLIPPDIARQELTYFNFQIPAILKTAKQSIYNIDLKSAYATILLNNLIITPKTFIYLSGLKKQDRLACIGMLAGTKNIFEYKKEGELISYSKTENELANFFYFAVWKTQEIMIDLMNLLGNDFLFYWVDGIYFKTESNKIKIGEYLKSIKYKYSFDVLTEFQVLEHKGKYFVFFKKEEEYKTFTVPKKNDLIILQLLRLMGIHKDKFPDKINPIFK